MAARKSVVSFYDRVAPVLLIVVIALAFAVGVLWQKVESVSGGSGTTNTAGTAANNNNAAAPAQPTSGKLTADQASKIPPVSDSDHVRGGKNPQVYLIEYSDFQCPYCAAFDPTAKQALSDYGDKFAWVYRHFPLDTIHPNARPAANASECIFALSGQDAFWKFADEVFADQDNKLADLSATAVGLGVNKASFDSCFSAKKYESIIDGDYQQGLTAGVTGTPGNFIMNSKGEVWELPGAVPYTTLKQTIDEALSS